MIIEYRDSNYAKDLTGDKLPVFESYKAEDRVHTEFCDRLIGWMVTEFGLKNSVETIRNERQAKKVVKRIRTMLTNKLYGEASNSFSFKGVKGEDGRVCIFVYGVAGDYSDRKDDAVSIALELGYFVDTGDDEAESVMTKYVYVNGDNMIDIIRELSYEIVTNATSAIRRHYDNLENLKGE